MLYTVLGISPVNIISQICTRKIRHLTKIKKMIPPLENNSSTSARFHPGMQEEKYEKSNIRVLRDDDNLREVLLMNEELAAQTYSITMKSREWRQCKEIREAAAAILKGEAISSSFKSHGFSTQKNVLDIFTINLPGWLQLAFANESKRAKASITEVLVKKQETVYNYCIITEIYSPAFQKPEITEIDEMQVKMPSLSLFRLGFSKQEIWAALEPEIAGHFAKLYSPVISEMKEKVTTILREALPLLTLYQSY